MNSNRNPKKSLRSFNAFQFIFCGGTNCLKKTWGQNNNSLNSKTSCQLTTRYRLRNAWLQTSLVQAWISFKQRQSDWRFLWFISSWYSWWYIVCEVYYLIINLEIERLHIQIWWPGTIRKFGYTILTTKTDPEATAPFGRENDGNFAHGNCSARPGTTPR